MITPLCEPEETPLPENSDAEQELIGACMINNDLFDYAKILQPEYFANALHSRIFEEMRRLIEAGRAADPTMLKAVFDQDPALQAHGGAAYLGQLVKAGMYRRARVEVEQLACLVHDCWLRRELILLNTEAIEAAYRVDIDNPPIAQVEGLEAGLRRLAESGQAGPKARSLSAMMAQTLANADAAYKRGDQITGVLTGFADLDKVLGGLHPSDLVVLAARPSMGKSALAENIARNAAKAGGGVCFCSKCRRNSSPPGRWRARATSRRIGYGAPPSSIGTATTWSSRNAALSPWCSTPMTRRGCRLRRCTRAPGD